MIWPDIHPTYDLQPRSIERREQLRARPQAQVLGQIGEYQPAFPSGSKCAVSRSRNPRSMRLSWS
jgi:hypothetical protein